MDAHKETVAQFALRLADDALVLNQRLCEWCAHAPLLEEDIAISNVGLDYLGRARMLLNFAGEAIHRTEDELAFLRDAHEFTNLLMYELPIGDFAFTQARHYLLDEFEALYFAALQRSAQPTLAAIAAKTSKEIRYHLRRSSEWMRRLGLGTAESNQRLQTAINELWGYTAELFDMDELEVGLVAANVAVDRESLKADWAARVQGMLAEVDIVQPADDWQVRGGRQGIHTEQMGHMLSEMQFMQRAYPGLVW